MGKAEAAAAAIGRLLAETSDGLRRAKVLPAQVEIMLALKDVSAARAAAGELREIADVYETPALRARASSALGAVLLAEGEARTALGALRGAWDAWRTMDAPYEAARVRVRRRGRHRLARLGATLMNGFRLLLVHTKALVIKDPRNRAPSTRVRRQCQPELAPR